MLRRALVVLLLLVSPAAAQYAVRVPMQPGPGFVGWVEDEFIVIFEEQARAALKPGTTAPAAELPSVQQLLRRFEVLRFARQFPAARARAGSPDLTGHYKVKLAPWVALDAAVSAFAADPNVTRVEKIGMHTLYATPNDPYYEDSPNPSFPFDQ
jgi:hypothetical protein